MQGQCKPNAESSLFAEAKPVLAAFSQKTLQNYLKYPIWQNKLHKISQIVHTLADLCNLLCS